MSIAQERLGDAVILVAGERLDVATAPEFERVVASLVDEGVRSIVVDLKAVKSVTSAGIGSFVQNAKSISQINGQIVLSGPNDIVQEVLERTNVTTLFKLYGSRDQAVEAVAGNAPAPAGSAPAPEASTSDLTLAEEILLLVVQEDGRLVDLPDYALEHALAGAQLMGLCIRRRIDSDFASLRVVDTTPTGDEVLDPVLKRIAGADGEQSAEAWIAALVADADDTRRRVTDRLVERGILKKDKNHLLWARGGRRYPVADGTQQRQVRERVLGIILEGQMPAPRDVVIIALADACAVFDAILEFAQMDRARDRIMEIARMDVIAQQMVKALVKVQAELRDNQ